MNNSKSKFYVDFLWYFAGSVAPALISFLKIPIFTRFFTPEEYGYFTLVSGSYTYFGMFLFGWISSCLWRYYIEFKNQGRITELYSNLFFLSFSGTIILFLITSGWLLLAGSKIIIHLILYSFLQMITGQILSTYLIVVRIKGKALMYNLIYSVQSVGAFGILFLFAFVFHYRIESILIGQVIINLFLIISIFLSLSTFPVFSKKSVTRETLKKLLTYGSVGLLTSFSILVLISSDRYIIALFSGINKVGIYNQVYMLGQLSIYQLVIVFFNTINPDFIKILSDNSSDKNKKINEYIHLFILLIFPLTVYFSIFSKQLANILLGEEFRTGYTMIPFIMFSSFIYGLTLFSETKFKFENRYRIVIIGVVFSSILNVILNFILIPIFDYKIAAVTTIISYTILFFIFYKRFDVRFLTFGFLNQFRKLFIILAFQIFFDFFLRRMLELKINEVWTVLEGLLFLIVLLWMERKHILKLISDIN